MPAAGVRFSILLLALAAACSAAPGPEMAVPRPAETPSCSPVSRSPNAGLQTSAMAGTFRLTLVATAGSRTGETTRGELRLRHFDAGMTRPWDGVLHGTTAIPLDVVGAAAPGPTTSDDPAKPGVLVLAWSRDSAGVSVREVTVRLGAVANAAGATPFDGTHMALLVGTIDPARFTGRWESGAGDVRAGGFFCAERLGASP